MQQHDKSTSLVSEAQREWWCKKNPQVSLSVNGQRAQGSPTAVPGIAAGILGGNAENPGMTLQEIEIGPQLPLTDLFGLFILHGKCLGGYLGWPGDVWLKGGNTVF